MLSNRATRLRSTSPRKASVKWILLAAVARPPHSRFSSCARPPSFSCSSGAGHAAKKRRARDRSLVTSHRSRLIQQGDSLGGDALPAADETELLGGLGL